MAALRRIANLFRSSRVDRDIADELQSHIDLRIESNLAAGMSPRKRAATPCFVSATRLPRASALSLPTLPWASHPSGLTSATQDVNW